MSIIASLNDQKVKSKCSAELEALGHWFHCRVFMATQIQECVLSAS